MILTSAATHNFSTATREMQYDISTREKVRFLIVRVTREKVGGIVVDRKAGCECMCVCMTQRDELVHLCYRGETDEM